MFANDFDSDREKIQSTILEMLAGLLALFLTLKWFKPLLESIRGGLNDAAKKGDVTILETVAKRIAE